MQTRQRLDIRLCGELIVAIGGRRVERDLPGRQGRLLVAFLAVAGRPVSREEAIVALWGAEASADRAAALNVVLSRTRRALGPEYLVKGRDRASLRLGPACSVDLLEAEALVREARDELTHECWQRARDAAEGAHRIVMHPVLPGYEAEWLEDQRRRAQEVKLDALMVLAEAGLALGGGDLVVAEQAARELIDAAALRESGWMLLMRALAARGNVAEALSAYEELRGRTLDELGVPPAPHVAALHESLLAGRLGPDDGRAARAASTEPEHQEAPVPVFSTRRSSPFVGRGDELERLTAAFERALGGAREIVRLVGEPGIGKTRLAVEFATACRERGAHVLYGRCDLESIVPYQPFVEALNHHVAHTPDALLAECLGPHGAELTRLLPALSTRSPELGTPIHDDPETQRYRLFEGVSHVLLAASRERPTVLILDDLQWADMPTLLLLRQIMRTPEHQQLLILAIYRENELVRSHPLVALFADLRRERLFGHVSLSGLAEDASTELIRAVGRKDVPPAMGRALWEETAGNPFFLEEMARHLADQPARSSAARPAAGDPSGSLPLPDEVRDVIGRRLDQLPAALVRLLETASVIGREFSLTLLAELVEPLERPLDEVLEQACEAQIIEEVPGSAVGRYTFTHALIRQALSEGCSAARRSRLHLCVAEAIERRYADELDVHLAELAHHFVQAGTDDARSRAVPYAVRAARQAGNVLAYEEAARLYGAALAALGGSGVDDDRRHELLVALGRAQLKAGDVTAARMTWRRAAEFARALQRPEAAAQAALGYGAAGQMQGGVVDRFMVELLEEALRQVGPSDSELRARLLGRMAVELRFTDESERRDAMIDEALDIARRVRSPRTIGIVLGQRHWALWGPENLPERLAAADDLLQLADQRGDQTLALQAHKWRLADLLELGDIDAVDVELDAYARLARDRHLPNELWYVPLLRAMRMLLAGEFAAAEGLMLQSRKLGEPVQADNATQAYVLQLLTVRREQGRLAEVEELVRAHRERYRAIAGWRAVSTYVHAELGHTEAARRGLAALAERGFDELPRDGLWLGAVAFLGEASARCGEPAYAERLYGLLMPYQDRNVGVAWLATCLGSAARVLGVLAATLSKWDAAAAHFERALEMNRRMGARPWVARTQLDYARMTLTRPDGERERAGRLLDAAVATARSLEMQALLHEAAALQAGEPAAR